MATSASLQLRDGVWQLRWYDKHGQPKQQSTGIKHDGKIDKKTGKPKAPQAAEHKKTELEKMLGQGKEPEKRTLSDLLCLVEKEYAVVKRRSLASMKTRLNHIRSYFKDQKASTLKTEDLLDYAAYRQAGGGADGVYRNRFNDKVVIRKPVPASNASVMLEMQMINKALGMAKLEIPDFEKLTLPAPRDGFFDDDMLPLLMTKLPVYLRAPVLIAYWTGWREGEVLNLKISDVDLKGGWLRGWDFKNQHYKMFPIDEVIADMRPLLERLVASPNTQTSTDGVVVHMPLPWLFTRKLKTTGEVLRVNEIRKAWDTACVEAGFPGKLVHDLRRSAARNLNNWGWPRNMIKEWCGWATDAMFERYNVPSPTNLQIVRNRLEQAAAIAARKQLLREA